MLPIKIITETSSRYHWMYLRIRDYGFTILWLLNVADFIYNVVHQVIFVHFLIDQYHIYHKQLTVQHLPFNINREIIFQLKLPIVLRFFNRSFEHRTKSNRYQMLQMVWSIHLHIIEPVQAEAGLKNRIILLTRVV